MTNQFKVAITPNYGRVIWKVVALFVGMILPIAFFGIAAGSGLIDPKEIPLEIVLPIYLVLVAVGTFLTIRKTHFKETVTLTDNALEIPTIDNVIYSEVNKTNIFSARGVTSYIITLKEGRKIAIGSTNNFSDEALTEFQNFINEFEKRITYQV